MSQIQTPTNYPSMNQTYRTEEMNSTAIRDVEAPADANEKNDSRRALSRKEQRRNEKEQRKASQTITGNHHTMNVPIHSPSYSSYKDAFASVEYDEESQRYFGVGDHTMNVSIYSPSYSSYEDVFASVEYDKESQHDFGVDAVEITAMHSDNNLTNTTPVEEDDDRMYPQDTYTILALNGPTEIDWPMEKICFVTFGLLPFIFQMAFLQLMLEYMKMKMMTDEDFGDEAAEHGGDSACIRQVRIAQALSLLAYVVFPNSTLQDLIKAIYFFPMRSVTTVADFPLGCLRIACIFRGLQGLFAIIIVFLLVISSNSTLDIILNFTAVNFITDLDGTAFAYAKSGVLGPGLKAETRRIAKVALPDCMYRKSRRKHVWYGVIMACTAIILCALMVASWIFEETFENILASLKWLQIVTGVFLVAYVARLAIVGSCRKSEVVTDSDII